jgi:hypothetical protein
LKQNLLKKIQEHKQRNEETPSNNGNNNGNNNSNNNNSNNNNTLSNQDLSNQFKMSTNYLEQLINKKKEARKHNKKSLSKPQPMMQPQMQQQMMQPQMQPMQPQMQQPMMQPQMQPMQQQMQPIQPMQMHQQIQQVSLELPPELQLNPITIPQSMVPMPQIVMPQSMTIPQIVMPQSMPLPMPVSMPQIEIQSEQLDSSHPNPNPIVLKDVPYGCLRGGNKPTYRTYHRGQIVQSQSQSHTDSHNTTVKKPLFSGITVSPDENVDPMIQERQRKLREIQENFQTQTQLAQTQSDSIIEPLVQMKNKIKQTITKKYKLGKTPGGNVVGVLIKNSDTRRRIQEEHGVLRRESIVEIRKYLHDHGLIKVGSDAPPDVLRNIYESAKMTGEISNTNKHVMLHNFMKSEHENADSH